MGKGLMAGLVTCWLVAGCNALGGIPPDTIDAIASAGGGCVKVNGIWGTGIVMLGSADKGVIRNGELSIAGDCGGIIIRETAVVRPVAPVPAVKP